MRPDVDPFAIGNRRDVRNAVEQKRADIDAMAIRRSRLVEPR